MAAVSLDRTIYIYILKVLLFAVSLLAFHYMGFITEWEKTAF